MKKLKVLGRGFNSRRTFRKLNSVTELVGKDVEVTDGAEVTAAEVDEVKVDTAGDVTLNLSTGDSVILDEPEASQLLEEGEVVTEEPEVKEPEVKEPEEFEVTREVINADGVPEEVTTTVSTDSMDNAEEMVKLIDSRRGRNSRKYRVCRSSDSMTGSERKNEPEVEEKKEFKITRVADCDGKKVRKTASVTATTVEDAIDAVKTKDTEDGIMAEDYSEVSETTEPEVVINSDVDEVIETEEKEEPKDEVVRSDKDSMVIKCDAGWCIEGMPDKTYDTEDEAVTAHAEMTAKEKEDAEERETNSFVGVSEFVRRKYGINL